ncbi:FkbM family methyltransferase [Herbaspirillum sp. GW103]|uniref:FkbM family methyltransferase n=1 Tax=Herbaspirillum sp. GW103 TaxID=1175306 RepID=UPI0009DA0CE7|nr:FkbM family methyltransferase [Herbaspirillum sp. GW103]
MREHKLAFSPLFHKLNIKINYLDVGARGDVAAPWSLFAEGTLNVIGFEPDPIECQRLQRIYPARTYYPHALWASREERTFYLYDWESTSSMYPPNLTANEQYAERHWTGRKPKKEFNVQCVALDDVLESKDTPDFIKLDTQGSEAAILSGAQNVLRDHHPLILAETWCTEVYKGAPLSHEIMRLLNEHGYEVFDLNVAAAWSHRSAYLSEINSKSRTVGFDLLFIKRSDQLRFQDHLTLLKFVALCELFGFRDYALLTLERSSFSSHPDIHEAIEILTSNSRWELSWRRKVSVTLKRLLRTPTALWPQLH